jgi:hypothetical protein
VPGTWVEAPQPGYLWTPGYWAANGAVFVWNAGYWGPQVGFYGGVNYGFGYGGRGYEGGYWQDGHLFYNRAVINVGSVHVTNVYNKTVVNNISVTRVSFNGGNGGVRAEPTAAEAAAARGPHVEATSAQRQQVETARGNPQLRASNNHGRPPVAATPRAGNFSNPVPARNAASPARNATVGAERPTPQPRLSTPRPAPEANAGARDIAPPQAHAAPVNTSRPPPAAVVEPGREPEHTQAPKPAPKPQAPRPAPKPTEHPAEHPAEHPQENEHH